MVCRKVLMVCACQEGDTDGKKFVEYVDHITTNVLTFAKAKDPIDKIRTIGNDANHNVKFVGRDDAKRAMSFDIGATYEFQGYKLGKYVGRGFMIFPAVAHDSFGTEPTSPDHSPPPSIPFSQEVPRYIFRYFGVVDLRRIDPVRFTPADFVDRKALIEGQAVNRNGRGFL
jgi:hypothetical protein